MPPTESAPSMDYTAGLLLALPDQHGRTRRLCDFRGRNVVVYFCPDDDMPGCRLEGKEFGELHDQFEAFDSVVVAVSKDPVEKHRAFAQRHGVPFVLLSDHEGQLAQAFGVVRDGVMVRSTFVLDRELRVRRAFHNVTPRGHAVKVLSFVRSVVESHRMLGG